MPIGSPLSYSASNFILSPSLPSVLCPLFIWFCFCCEFSSVQLVPMCPWVSFCALEHGYLLLDWRRSTLLHHFYPFNQPKLPRWRWSLRGPPSAVLGFWLAWPLTSWSYVGNRSYCELMCVQQLCHVQKPAFPRSPSIHRLLHAFLSPYINVRNLRWWEVDMPDPSSAEHWVLFMLGVLRPSESLHSLLPIHTLPTAKVNFSDQSFECLTELWELTYTFEIMSV